ncbi:hypothetical protein B0H10DRAFT_1997414 [Mycena sp. CBHHK59/15]|nr:hypothetical protein B0H10DRAFT_1997414 [Mycena sp. CBHHK59/15]
MRISFQIQDAKRGARSTTMTPHSESRQDGQVDVVNLGSFTKTCPRVRDTKTATQRHNDCLLDSRGDALATVNGELCKTRKTASAFARSTRLRALRTLLCNKIVGVIQAETGQPGAYSKPLGIFLREPEISFPSLNESVLNRQTKAR